MEHVSDLTMVAIEKLIPYERNARTHSPEQITKLRESLREFGFVNPVLIDGQNRVIAGHGRLEAAKAEGLTEAPCVVVEHLTDAQRRAYVLADNRLAEMAGWDESLLALELGELQALGFDVQIAGFEAADIPDPTAEDDLFDLDAALDDIGDSPVTKPGDIWLLGKHRLMCGDSTSSDDMALLMQGENADLLLTDPPYNVAYGDKAAALSMRDGSSRRTDAIRNDDMPPEDFSKFLTAALSCAGNSCRAGCAMYVFHAHSSAREFLSSIEAAGFGVHQTLIWEKNSLVLGRQDYQWRHEPIFYGWKNGAAHYFTADRSFTSVIGEELPDLSAMTKAQLLEWTTSFLDRLFSAGDVIQADRPSRNTEHPTMKPVPLMAQLMSNSTRRGNIVLDPFGGAGATLLAAQELGRSARCMEIEPKYCDATARRFTAWLRAHELPAQLTIVRGEEQLRITMED